MKKLLLSFLVLLSMMQDAYASNIEKAGDVLLVLIPSIVYGSTLYLNDEEGEIQFYKSFATNLGVTAGLKYTVNRVRPNGENYSFPSGHTSVAFQGASFIHKRYGFKYAIPAYLAATFVGYSRVESDAHYTSDVIAGAVIGAMSSFYFTSEYHGYSIKPSTMKSGYGITVSKRW